MIFKFFNLPDSLEMTSVSPHVNSNPMSTQLNNKYFLAPTEGQGREGNILEKWKPK